MKAILLTGGVGDVIAVESLMTDEERKSINGIFYATRAAKPCIELFTDLPTFPKLKKQTSIWYNFRKIFAFNNKKELTDKLCDYKSQDLQTVVKESMQLIDDYSIEKIFHENRNYSYSSFIINNLANITKFNLPKNYYCICPYSSNDKRDTSRDYNGNDWTNTLRILKERNVIGVVINIGNEYVPEDPCLINLSNKTTIREALEVVKNSVGYIGIDSAFSVIATKVCQPDSISIKSRNGHCYRWKHIYFAPQQTFDFLKEIISF